MSNQAELSQYEAVQYRTMRPTKLNPVFIGGHRKCGTTMFANLFDGHPELCVYPVDLTIMYAYFPVFEDGRYSEQDRKDRLDTVVFKHLAAQPSIASRLDVDAFRDIFFKRMESRSYVIEDVLEELLLSYRELIGMHVDAPKATLAKETSIEIYASHLFRWFPKAKFIHLIRDPRDNYAALKAGVKSYYSQFDDDNNTVLHSLIERSSLGMKLADINQARFGSEHYLIIRFEDVLNNPRKTLSEVSEFLEVAFDEALLLPTLLGGETRGNNFEGSNFSRISNENAGRWRERIAPEEAMIIEFHFQQVMQRFGYDLSYSVEERADAAMNFYKWSNYKYHYFDRFVARKL